MTDELPEDANLGVVPTQRARILVALAIGVAAGFVAWRLPIADPSIVGDFGQVPAAARALLTGGNPYDAVGPGRTYDWPWPLLYPLTAVLVGVPFAGLSHLAANMAFVSVSAALLAYALTRDGYYRLPLFVSGAYFYALSAAQWSPLLTAAALLPALGWLLVAKPTIGLALFLYRPNWRTAIGCASFVALSFAVRLTWPRDWLHALSQSTHLAAPITVLGGPLIALAVLRWRRPEARLLLVLACVPQTLTLVEAVPLFLVASNLRQALVLAWLTHVGVFLTEYSGPYPSLDARVAVAGPILVALVYLPCVVMLLRRPNEGNRPAWMDAALARAAQRLRGRRSLRPA